MFYNIENRNLPFTCHHVSRLLPQPHIHSHLELIYMIDGTSKVFSDNQMYELNSGDLFLSFPNQIHFYHSTHSLNAYLVIFASDYIKEFKDLLQTKTPIVPIIHANRLLQNIGSRLAKMEESLKSSESFQNLVAKGELLSLLAEILPCFSLQERGGDSDSVKRILTYCIKHYQEPLSLEKLSRELYLNKYYISHVFTERFGINYKDFINQLRVEYACELLESNASMTDIAFTSGFTSIRTFNRAFSKHAGISPREYLKTQKKIQK